MSVCCVRLCIGSGQCDCSYLVDGKGPSSRFMSGVLYGCARLAIHISGGSTDGCQPLLLISN